MQYPRVVYTDLNSLCCKVLEEAHMLSRQSPRLAGFRRRRMSHQRMLQSQRERPRRIWELAVIRREDARLIGACAVTLEDGQAGRPGLYLRP